MKKYRLHITILIALSLLIVGCKTEVHEIDHADGGIKTIYDINPIPLIELSGTYVGYNVGVAKLISHLAAGGTTSFLSLQGEAIETHYELEHGNFTKEDIYSFWYEDEKTVQQVFLNNAIYLTLLVPNAKGFTFHLDGQKFQVTRGDMELFIKDELPDFPANGDLWDRDVVSHYLLENQENIIAIVENEDVLTRFYDQHPLLPFVE